jgi:hypothetical protein
MIVVGQTKDRGLITTSSDHGWNDRESDGEMVVTTIIEKVASFERAAMISNIEHQIQLLVLKNIVTA